MMKKMLVMLILVCLVSAANAGVINLVSTLVDNDLSGSLTVGDKVVLKVNSTVALDAYDLNISVVGGGTLAVYDGGPNALLGGSTTKYTKNRQMRMETYFDEDLQENVTIPQLGTSASLNDAFWVYVAPAGNTTRVSWTTGLSANSFVPGDLVWGLAVDVTAVGALNINLLRGPGDTGLAGGTPVADFGSLNLNVVPEPITVALLGLGGLFIRRRKVA